MGMLSCVERATQWRDLHSFNSYESRSKTSFDHTHVLVVYLSSRRTVHGSSLARMTSFEREAPTDIALAPMKQRWPDLHVETDVTLRARYVFTDR